MNEALLSRLLSGSSDAGLRFNDLRALLADVGFNERIKGSHHIFTRHGVTEILNLQPQGSLAKPYQVKQVRKVLVQYKLVRGAK
ncbi:MAG: type II toxin-antitoxin system HicA family toxin [Acidobacteria bacterium]|nr:type II toxin-antitoxin system HicA family toxin [Acidobacteriota bacterium]